jgi:hypothetical protein
MQMLAIPNNCHKSHSCGNVGQYCSLQQWEEASNHWSGDSSSNNYSEGVTKCDVH